MANVDGRNVPLTVGYHKVTVDIRDQIARTVIEESFVNHTDGRLEGVFYFPLPQDASISGFGMWIGDELVEADVVEKQRAREIYETILREQRDPGLLEWTGGNIFKARVFPIEAAQREADQDHLHAGAAAAGQPLPLQLRPAERAAQAAPAARAGDRREGQLGGAAGGASRRRRTPRAIDQTAALGPRRVRRPGVHARRATSRWWSRWTAGQSDVVLIPHRRGDDGYFMLHADAARGRRAQLAARASCPTASRWTC